MSQALSPRVGRAFYGVVATKGLRRAQEGAIEPLLAGRDCLVVAGTGSGKTEAVVAPLVGRHLADGGGRGPVVVYVAPTRALVNDVHRRLEGPFDQLGLLVGIRHGERDDLSRKSPPDLVVTTPESFDSVLTTRPHLFGQVRAVVVDEVHQLAGDQRGLQLRHVLARLEHRLGRPLQVAGMSATVEDPLSLWARLRDAVPALVEAADERARRYVLARRSTEAEFLELFRRLEASDKVLCFVNSRREAERLAGLLRDEVFGGRVFVHHSALSKDERLATEEAFRRRERAICVATSTLELGIDIGDVRLVVLVGPPADWRSFSQRVGRANRRGGDVQVLCVVPPWSLVPARDTALFLALVDQLEGGDKGGVATGPLYGATAQQVVGELRAGRGWRRAEDLAGALRVELPVVEAVLDGLVDAEVVQRHPVQRRLGLGPAFEDVERRGELLSNFPTGSRSLKVYARDRLIGEVPFTNVVALADGTPFAFLGRVWTAERCFRDELHVREHKGKPVAEVKYHASGAPLALATVSRLARVIRGGLPAHLRLERETAEWWPRAAAHLGEVLTSDKQTVVRWRSDGQWHHLTLAGRVLNGAVARLVGDPAPQDDCVLISGEPVDFGGLPADPRQWETALANVLTEPTELTTWQQRLPADLLREELVQEVLTHPQTARTVERLRTARVVDAPDDRLSALYLPRRRGPSLQATPESDAPAASAPAA